MTFKGMIQQFQMLLLIRKLELECRCLGAFPRLLQSSLTRQPATYRCNAAVCEETDGAGFGQAESSESGRICGQFQYCSLRQLCQPYIYLTILKNLTTQGRALSCRLALGLLVRNSGRRIFDRRKVVRQCRLPPTNQRGGPATGKRGRSHRKKSPRRPGSWGSLNRMRLRP